jgi:hypothetical protein
MGIIIPFDANRARCGHSMHNNVSRRRASRKHNRKSNHRTSIFTKLFNFYKNHSVNVICGSLMFTNAYNDKLYCALSEG